MATYVPQKLSGSTNGRGIKVVATATAGTLIHTAHATDTDFIDLWVVNSSATAVKLTIEFGGVTVPDDLIEFTIPAEDGLYEVIRRMPVTGGVVVRAWAATANVLVAFGKVTRYTA